MNNINLDALSTLIEFTSLLFSAMSLFMNWPKFEARLRESTGVKFIWKYIIPILLIVLLIASYYLILFYVGSLGSQTPLPLQTGRSAAYLFLTFLLLSQLYFARIKEGKERRRFIVQSYMTVGLIVLLTISIYLLPFGIS